MPGPIGRCGPDGAGFLAGPSFAQHQTRFAEHFVLDRRDGILTVRVHHEGGAALWSRGLLNAWNLLLGEISADRDTELVIITGTGDAWLAGVDFASFAEPMHRWAGESIDEQYNDGVKLLERVVNDLDVPTIAAINGPGPRLELPLLCDLTLCTPDVVIGDGNFSAGSAPGDGLYLVLHELIGAKRANHMVYTGEGLRADQARDLGLINEVVPRRDLLPRATRLAENIMAKPRTARRMTHRLAARGWQRRMVADLRHAYAHQLLTMAGHQDRA
ncbi:enoyl-CoA hydratase/isomerase family protein [Dactylosporangium aurantiacum]|uniref:Enoyl-CoA hydratase/isomerase family protein n=1 Tax=Dactylosporangium aurantiacum TaxID=35754 RepID=A0A9Q9IRH8_9ACTN|nr:enoyl-CoA hydratase/isomerase family protein [Dactylosporangium aurantiacum]MDG6109149.1 enoyl-CoA hydratase/isomerase family protein [Dactylosporangium aurantiacum]UWZ58477.1 enoyl-CoA hydratase/isomerase family protein [Dactylosporangium aurantiacum]